MAKKRTLFGPQTKLALKNFPISGWPVASEVIRSLALIKRHAAIVNGGLQEIPKGHASAIAATAKQIQLGKHHDQFTVDVFQTGSGTSSNMNVNEVIATLASSKSRAVHPNDHVNRCQSSNDVFPSAVHIGCALRLRDHLIPEMITLKKALITKSKEFKKVIKTARTHLMDAVPISLGDEFSGYADLIGQSIERLNDAQKKLCALPLGGTAAGTGLNAHKQFAKKVIAGMKTETGLALTEAKNHYSAQSCPLALLQASSALRETAVALNKIANDIRWMGSGPCAGIVELQLPALQAGSSIMPGKVNPVLCESVMQVNMYVRGADATVQAAVAEGSQFELCTAYPVISQSLIMSMRLLANVTKVFTQKCMKGLEANIYVIEHQINTNPMLVTALAPIIGYEKAAKIAYEAMCTTDSIVDVAARMTDIPKAKLRKILDPSKMC